MKQFSTINCINVYILFFTQRRKINTSKKSGGKWSLPTPMGKRGECMFKKITAFA